MPTPSIVLRKFARSLVVSFSVLMVSGLPLSARAQDASLAPSGQFSVYRTTAAQTPPMGWNPWNAFRTDVDETKVREVAKAMVDNGLAGRGYRFVNVDDGWALKRLPDGRIRIRDSMFPSAAAQGSVTGTFKPFTDYIHALGLKVGLYTDIGRNTCAQRWDAESPNLPVGTVDERQVGSYGHAVQDIRTIFADWNFDYIKIDACGVADYTPDVAPVKAGLYQVAAPLIVRGNIPASDPREVEHLYAVLGDAVHKWGGEDATMSICAWGEALSPLWGKARGNLWRTSPDIEFTWQSMLGNIDSVIDGALYAGPGHWNDPDMLAIGHGDFDAAHLTEARAHFTMWTIMASPLLLGYDLRKSPTALLDIVGNPEAIAIDQDPAGNQGVPYRNGAAMVVVRTLTGQGARAVAFLNRSAVPIVASVSWAQLGLKPGTAATVRDIWTKRDRAAVSDKISVDLPAHGAVLLRVTGKPSDPAAAWLDEMPARVNVAVDGLTQATALPMGQFPVRIGATPDGLPIRANGNEAQRGIGAFANSRLEIRADRAFRRFVVAPAVLSGQQPVRFRVYADRKLVREVVAEPAQAAVPIDMDVTSAKIVELVALAPSGAARPPMIAWGNARFLR
jgi:alpha-galactosidase